MKATRANSIDRANRYRPAHEPRDQYAAMSDAEIARILTRRGCRISRQGVQDCRKRAMKKLREALRELSEELFGVSKGAT